MNHWSAVTIGLTLAADAPELQRWERALHVLFKDAFDPVDNTFPATSVLLIFLGLMLLLASIWGWRWHQRRHLRSEPMIVFHQLAGQMGLSLRQQWLLVRIAHRQALPTPLTLMLSSATLRHHAGRFAQALAPSRRPALQAKVDVIARLLFDQVPQSPTPVSDCQRPASA